MMYLDLAELPDLFRQHRLYSAESPAAAWFRRKDYLGDPELDLDTAVRNTVQSATGRGRMARYVCLHTCERLAT